MRNVGGIAQTKTQKAQTFYEVPLFGQRSPEGAALSLPPAPISNSMGLELYTIQRYFADVGVGGAGLTALR